MGRIDAHCHLWTLARGDYTWLDPSNPDLKPIARDFVPADLQTELAQAGIGQAVLVQAAATVTETDFMLSLADKTPQIAGVVGWVDLTDLTAIDDIARLAKNPAFKGVRPMLQDIDQDDWIITQAKQPLIDALRTHGLRFDALVCPQHLSHLLQFTRQNPDLPVVIDHAAKPTLSDLSDPSWDIWRRDMALLAQEPQVFCKCSGLLTEMGGNLGQAPEILKSVLTDLLDWFGPPRLMWGSDWPVLNLAGDYGYWNQLSGDLVADLSDDERQHIFQGAAQTFYDV